VKSLCISCLSLYHSSQEPALSSQRLRSVHGCDFFPRFCAQAVAEVTDVLPRKEGEEIEIDSAVLKAALERVPGELRDTVKGFLVRVRRGRGG
jgi:hypothetical protein